MNIKCLGLKRDISNRLKIFPIDGGHESEDYVLVNA